MSFNACYLTFYIVREGGRYLQSLSAEQRSMVINKLAESLLVRQNEILDANLLDLKEADRNGVVMSSRNRLVLTSSKLKSLAAGNCFFFQFYF